MVGARDEEISPDQLQIKLDNPRHEKKDEYPAAMKELVDSERVVELAATIAEMGGLNPMDRIGVVRDEGSPGDAPTYIAAEGNRRVAALMLLDDPERLPPNVNQRAARVRRLEQASRTLGGLDTVQVVVFPSFEAADPWVDLMHVANGTDGGRRRWNPTQQARRNGETGNTDAVLLIAAARKADVIAADEASRIAATNVQRIVSSNARRGQLGLVGTGENLRRTLAWDAFRVGLEKLMRDQIDCPGEHNSRALNTADKLNAYVATVVRAMGAPAPLPDRETRPLSPIKSERKAANGSGGDPDGSTDRGPHSGPGGNTDGNGPGADGFGEGAPDRDGTPNNGSDESGQDDRQRSSNVPRGGVIAKSAVLESAIAALGDANLVELYGSITTVSARQHPVIVCIGCSTLLELLFRLAGWDGTGALTKKLMAKSEVRKRYDTAAIGHITSVLSALRGRASLSKHDARLGGVHGETLIKDMVTLEGVFTAVADLAVARKGSGG